MAALNVTDELEGTLHQGWLQKRGGGNVSSAWKQRYFMLETNQLDSELKYFTKEPEKGGELKGSVNLQEVLTLRDDVGEKKGSLFGPNSSLRFDVAMKDRDRTYELLAPSAEACMLARKLQTNPTTMTSLTT
jgi:hypothetical protein